MFLAPKNFFWEAPPKFWTKIIKLNILSSIVQNFVAIGPRSLEITRGEKKGKKTTAKQKSFRKLLFSGGLTMTSTKLTMLQFSVDRTVNSANQLTDQSTNRSINPLSNISEHILVIKTTVYCVKNKQSRCLAFLSLPYLYFYNQNPLRNK